MCPRASRSGELFPEQREAGAIAHTAHVDEAQQMARKLERFEIRHALREHNRDADRLANEAMDRGK